MQERAASGGAVRARGVVALPYGLETRTELGSKQTALSGAPVTERPETQRVASLANERSEGKAEIASLNSLIVEVTGLISPFQQSIQAQLKVSQC